MTLVVVVVVVEVVVVVVVVTQVCSCYRLPIPDGGPVPWHIGSTNGTQWNWKKRKGHDSGKMTC